MKGLLAIALACTLLAAAPPAHAQSDEARVAFEEGRRLYDQGDCEAALPQFRRALELTASPNARLFVARCLEKRGDLAAAYQEMAHTMREAAERAESDEKYAPTRDAAAASLALLDRRVAKLIVVVSDAPSGTEVLLDRRAIAAADIGQPIALAPGRAVVSASAPGRASVEKEVELAAGKTTTVALVLPEPEREPPSEAANGGGVRIAGFAIAGVGVLGMAAFAGAGAVAIDKEDTLEEACGSARCGDPSFATTVDEGKTAQTIANVALGIGASALAAGTAMIIFGGADDEPDTGSLELTIAPDRALVHWLGRF